MTRRRSKDLPSSILIEVSANDVLRRRGEGRLLTIPIRLPNKSRVGEREIREQWRTTMVTALNPSPVGTWSRDEYVHIKCIYLKTTRRVNRHLLVGILIPGPEEARAHRLCMKYN